MSYSGFAGCRSFVRRCTFVLVIAGFALRSDVVMAAAPGAPVVRTTAGAVRGISAHAMQAFLGIPYAAPPVGALRWEPPQAPPSWSQTRDATGFANHCPQNASPFGFRSVSEDCLYLNVFAPGAAKAGAKLPVMVWIHGGGFTDGESDDYDPDRLVAHGVVVVTLNYRLGYLGFLATTGLDSEPHTHVNYGLLDQQAALAWTHANIASFGGDPAHVTLFGQSAGGESVFAQLLSPGSAGLFNRALIDSGAYGILSLPTLAAAQTSGNAIAAALGCAPTDTVCLRSATVPQILALEAASGSPLAGGPSPAIDGTMIPLAPATALEAGSYNHVPIVQGSNHDEFRLFTALLFDLAGGPLTAAEYPAAVTQTLSLAGLGSHAGQVLAQYPLSKYASPDLAYSAFATDAVFSTQAYLTDALLNGAPSLYAYEFADEEAPEDFLPPVSFPYASAHGSELQFIFDSFDRTPPKLTPRELHLAAVMAAEWTDFARLGTPNGLNAPLWPPFVALADDMESLVPPTPDLFFDFVGEHKVLFWANLFGALSERVSHPAITLDTVRAAARTLRPQARLF
jgi:para-nitrobenzyl esterase